MYDRFTDRSRKVMQLANQEAQRFQHEYIGTEHILLALVKEASGVASNVLRNMDVDLRKIRLEVERHLQVGPELISLGKFPLTPRAKKVLDFAIDESRKLNHNYVGTEHVLLGLVREPEGIAGHVLKLLGVTLEAARAEVVTLLKGDPTPRMETTIRIPVSNGCAHACELRHWSLEGGMHYETTPVQNAEFQWNVTIATVA